MSKINLKDQVRLAAEQDLIKFINLVHPDRVLGQVHIDLIRWWNREDAKSHQLCLLPRDHQKSAMVAYRVAWEITRNPALRVLYISSTAKLAIKQLKFIKDIFTCDAYRFYWPEMVNALESDREKWTETEIAVDHPARKKENVRDPTIFTAGLTTNIVGMHCDISVLDDVIVSDTAYSEDGREKVRTQVSYLASIAGADSKTWVVGTRYHPNDLYDDLQGMVYEMYNENGDMILSEHLYEVYERKVEDRGDGTGQYLWPRQRREQDGKWFGFNQEVLSKKKAQYSDIGHFRAQYYNDPNDYETATITKDLFQYYNTMHLTKERGTWYINNRRINVFASIDFAFSLAKAADYSCIVVCGIDQNHNIYVLDIDRFKSNKISEYYERIFKMYNKWGFRKIRAEVTVAQQVIVEDLKHNYIRPNGIALSIDEFRPLAKEGSKEERIEAILQPRYANRQVWHYPGGNCSLLEQELVLKRPPHDDIKDALASCVDICVAPSSLSINSGSSNVNRPAFNSRFGGYG